MRVALVHDHLMQVGGAEKVLQVFQEIWPEAPVFTLLYNEDVVGSQFDAKKIKTSYLQKFPWSKKHYQWLLPLMPSATESYDLKDFDVVISSSSAFAKGVITHGNTLHICYCHTPTRYLWSDTHAYIKNLPHPWFIKKIIPFTLSKLRLWDSAATKRVDTFLSNSKFVSERIKKYYGRESSVVYPPVDTQRFGISDNIQDYFLTGGRLVSYKRFDITINAFNRLGISLKIFGDGPELESLKKMARPNIEFLGRVSEEKKSELYRHAKAFIHPQVEDFGITAIEAMASGRPVIAYGQGGASETIIENITGTFFEEQTWEDLADTVIRFDESTFNPQSIQEHALQYSIDTFKTKMRDIVQNEYFKKQNL